MLDKLKQQVAKATHGRGRKVSSEDAMRIQTENGLLLFTETVLSWSIW